MMINDLLRTIEKKTGLKMKYNHEFTQLSKLIFEATHEYISTTTLKRMWGYINDRKSEPRITTLNLLEPLSSPRYIFQVYARA